MPWNRNARVFGWYKLTVPCAVDDSFLDGFGLVMTKLEDKLKRAMTRGGGVAGDPNVKGIHDQLTQAHAELLSRMDQLEDARDGYLDLHVGNPHLSCLLACLPILHFFLLTERMYVCRSSTKPTSRADSSWTNTTMS